jgi:hypothetical protein
VKKNEDRIKLNQKRLTGLSFNGFEYQKRFELQITTIICSLHFNEKRDEDLYYIESLLILGSYFYYIQVMANCASIPTYTPIATFKTEYAGVRDHGGLSGIFLGCTNGGFKVRQLVIQM